MASNEQGALALAIREWKEVLGEVSSRTETTSHCTFQTDVKQFAILKPRNSAEIVDCLRVANRYNIALYPISTGKNWGYGSANPVKPAAILDLSLLNQILDYDRQLGTVTLEPGVTQSQLHEFLENNGDDFWMDATGSSGDCSVLGNTLERGFGHSPYSDHAGQVVSMRVMLTDGRIISTGMGQFAGNIAEKTHASSLGPGLGGLFLQSNLGIVLQITINLMPRPDYFQAVYFNISRDSQLIDLVDALQPLRLHGHIQSAMHIGNAYRVLSTIEQYPWDDARGVTPLPEHVLEMYAKKWKFGAWNGSGALYGTRRQVAESRKIISKRLKNMVDRLQFMDDRGLEVARKIQKPYQWFTGVNLPKLLKLIEPVHEMMKGKPTDRIIASTYWRKKMEIPKHMNPDRDGCGLIWSAHVAPTRGKYAREMADIATAILLKHGFEPGMTLTLINQRNIDNVISISYDRSVDGEDERALICYQELSNSLINKGYYPYRLGTHNMGLFSDHADSEYLSLLKGLKKYMDPQGILSPGRYIP